MRYILAMFPILVVLGLMIGRRWGTHQAGPVAWITGLLIAGFGFGLTPEVLRVSQEKALLLSLFVLAVMWPALFLYHWVDGKGGIIAVARAMERALPNRGMCLILLAWALSGLLEGLAGFGLPIAVVAPMLTALGVRPLTAIAAVAVGHSWAVTFGDMGVILQTLVAVVGLEASQIVPWAALLLGLACLLCGLVTAVLLGEWRQWPKVVLVALVMASTQYVLAAAGLVPLSAFGAGLAGILGYAVFARCRLGSGRPQQSSPEEHPSALVQPPQELAGTAPAISLRRAESPLALALGAYGGLALLMATITLLPQPRAWAQSVAWKAQFPAVVSRAGFSTAAAPSQVFRPLAHPGALILAVALAGILLGERSAGAVWRAANAAGQATRRSAGAASLGIIAMVGLSTLMDHCGMSHLLAQGLSALFGAGYPLVSPCVGILGAFATGSNNNSNVLFGPLQKDVALMLGTQPELLAAAQTAGGSLGSMLAPAKIVVGCGTVGQFGREGEVLRCTVPYGLAIGLAVGLLTLILTRLR